RRGITGKTADEIVHQITSFALYGFPESHSPSFALLAYASAYLKAHHGPAFYTALLNNQPMGFYHSATLVNDARRHGVPILPVDVRRSDWLCTLERRDDAWAVRLGLRFVKGLLERAALALIAARTVRPLASPEDLAARAELTREEMTTLASIGALRSLGGTRRANLWRVADRGAGPLFALTPAPSGAPSPLRDMNALERLVADYGGTGVTLGPHPMALRRASLAARGVTRAIDLVRGENDTRVRVAGRGIVRQAARAGPRVGVFWLREGNRNAHRSV